MPPKLWTPRFAGMLLLILLGFANLATFYGLEPFLRGRGLSAAEAGIAIAGFTLVALLLIPTLSRRLTPATAGRAIIAGFAVTLVALPLYALGQSFAEFLAIRLLHGLGFVLTLTGIITAFVALVPSERAGEAYSLFGVADLLPFALLPPLLEASLPGFGGDPGRQYTAMALVQAVALVVAILIARGQHTAPAPLSEAEAPAPKSAAVLTLLGVNTLAFLAHALLFSLLKPRALELEGAALVGAAFGAQTAVVMALRLLAGGLFDKLEKRRTAAAGLALVALGLVLLALPLGSAVLLPSALLFGLGFGAALPLLNALMHAHSPPEARGANLNLMMLTLQVGYLAGPLLGGFVAGVAGYGSAFLLAALLLVPALPLVLRLPK